MKKYLFITTAVICAAILVSCEIQNSGVDTYPDVPLNADLTKADKDVVENINSFGFKLFDNLYDEEKSMLISPFSVSLAMSMLTTGANGNTAEQLLSALGFAGKSIEELDGFYGSMMLGLASINDGASLNLANSGWFSKSIQVKSNFTGNCKKYFDADLYNVDFGSNYAINSINSWCSEKTNGKISHLIDELPSDIVMMLINALYFKGAWGFEFGDTISGSFNGISGAREVRYISDCREMPFRCGTKYNMVALPYGKGSFKMAVIVPADGYGTKEAVESVAKEWPNLFTSNNKFGKTTNGIETDLLLPEFKVSYETNLVETFKAMGVTDAFSAKLADFTGISDAGMIISKILHKTNIEVDRKGTEAAAITAIVMDGESGAEPSNNVLHADRPFAFFLYEQESGEIILMGTYCGE